MDSQEPDRQPMKLGLLDKTWSKMHQHGYMQISRALLVSSTVPLEQNLLKQSLKILRDWYEKLNWTIKKDEAEDTYIFTTPEDDTPILETVEETDWTKVLHKETLTPYDTPSRLLWRVIHMPHADWYLNRPSCIDIDESDYEGGSRCCEFRCVLFFSHAHVLMDGMSANCVIADFISILNHVIPGRDIPIKYHVSTPPMEDLYIPPVTLCPDRLLVENMMGESPRNIFIEKFGVEILRYPDIQPTTSPLTVHLSEKKTCQILSACKKRGVTLQHAFHTAVSYVIVQVIQGGNICSKTEVQARFVINMKGRGINLPPNALGNYIIAAICPCIVEEDPKIVFWKKVEEVKSSMNNALTPHSIGKSYKLLSYLLKSLGLQDIEYSCAINAGSPLFNVTNTGNVNYMNRGPEADVRVHGIFPALHEPFTGSLFNFMLVTVDNSLCCTMLYRPHICSKERSMQVLEEAFHLLSSSCV